jgi:hypothetical protein
MRRHVARPGVAFGLLLITMVLAAPLTASAQAVTRWRATLLPSNEVPPTTSSANGAFQATVNEASNIVAWSLAVQGIEAGSATVHFGGPRNVGPVIASLVGPESGSVTSASGRIEEQDLSGPFAGDFSGFVGALENGSLYVNVRTVSHPAGELRAQISSASQSQLTPPSAGSGGFIRASDRAVTMMLVALAVASAGLIFSSTGRRSPRD